MIVIHMGIEWAFLRFWQGMLIPDQVGMVIPKGMPIPLYLVIPNTGME